MALLRTLLCTVVAGLAGPVVGGAADDPRPAGIPWAESFDKALEAAREAKRPLLVDFEAEWCGWCKKLDRETYGDERVIRFVREHFVAVKVDTDEQPDIGKKYKVSGLPTILFLSPEGEELQRLTGFRPPDAFLKEAAKPAESAAKLSELKEAAEKSPDDLAAQRAYARALFAAGNAAGAVEILKKAEEKNPDEPGLLLDLADMLRTLRKLDEARPHYERILALPAEKASEEQAKTRFPLAQVLIASGQHSEAVGQLGKFLAEEIPAEERFQALFLRAYCHAVLKDAASALADLRRARDLDKESPWSLNAGYIMELVESR